MGHAAQPVLVLRTAKCTPQASSTGPVACLSLPEGGRCPIWHPNMVLSAAAPGA